MNRIWGTSRRAFRLLAVAILASGIATADTIVATGVDSSLGEYNLWIDQQGTDVNTYFAGVIDIQLTDDANKTFDRYTMCVDLFTDIDLGTSYGTTVEWPSQVSPPQSPALLGRVAWLEDNALLPVLTPGDPSVLPSSDWADTSAMGAGLQLAIWDITVDGGDGFSTGGVQAATGANPTDPTTLAWAETYESLSAGMWSNAAYVYENAGAQTLEGPEYLDNGPAPVAPESSTVLLVGAALLAVGRMGRRRLGSR